MITANSHLPAALALPGIEVAAIVDPVIDRAQRLASDFAIAPRIAADLSSVFGHVDGAVIATPNDTHLDLALACLARGVHTLIEKPLARTVSEGKAILAAAEQAGMVVAVGYATRFRDNVIELAGLLKTRHFGVARRFAHQYGTRGGWAPVSGYHLNRATTGGGVLIVTGTHFLDRLLSFWGSPDDVALDDDSLGGPEANCVARFRYSEDAGGLSGTARYSKTMKLPGGLVIETDEGVLALADYDESRIQFRPHRRPGTVYEIAADKSTKRFPRGMSVFERQLYDFVDAARSGHPPMVDARQGVESLCLIERLYAMRAPMQEQWYSASGGDLK